MWTSICTAAPRTVYRLQPLCKMGVPLQRSLAIGADYIATGHYSRIEQLPNGRYAIRNSVTAAKDQTYALYNLTQEQLKRTLMPVGEYSKDQIRVMGRKDRTSDRTQKRFSGDLLCG